MNHFSSPGSAEQRKHDEPAPERRRLLKAAAAAAPVIATLPCGSARATSSSSQCFIEDRADTQGGTIQGAVASSDGFVRTDGYGHAYQKTSGQNTYNLTVFSIGDTGNPPYYFGASGSTGVGPTSYDIGTEFDPSSFDGGGWILIFTGPNQLMRLYRGYSDSGDVLTDPTCAEVCDPDTTDPSSTCVYPLSHVGTDTNAPYGENMGLTTSCYTSLTPGGAGSCSA